MSFKLSLETRLRIAERRRERYRAEPAYRLRIVNQARARLGKPPLDCVSQIKGHAERGDLGAMGRARDELGRFL